MPLCATCMCGVRSEDETCMQCRTDPPPPAWMDTWNGEDAAMCVRCDALLCPLHTDAYQLAHQQCYQCVQRGGRRRARDEESEQFASSAEDWDSSSGDHSPENSEDGDNGNSEDEAIDSHQVMNTWFTQPHVNKRIRHSLYSKPGSSQGDDDKCSICLDKMDADTQVVQLPCAGQHGFHTPCISQWLSTHSTCPLCLTSVYVVIHS